MDFKRVFRGYDPDEVDKYIADISEKEQKIRRAQKERIDELSDENYVLRERIGKFQADRNAISDSLVASQNLAITIEQGANDYADKVLRQAKTFYATWQAYARTVVATFTDEELKAFNELQKKIEYTIEEYEQNTLCSLRKREPTSDGASDKSESSVAAANGEPSASDRQNPISKVAKAAEQIIDLRELTRVEDSLEDICADLGLITPDKEKE